MNNFAWSSHQGYISKARKWEWLLKDFLLSMLFQQEEQIAISKRGTENLPRDVAIYLVRHHSRDTLSSVGRHFDISNYSTVSSVVERIKARKNKDQLLQKHLEKIGEKLFKSQRQT